MELTILNETGNCSEISSFPQSHERKVQQIGRLAELEIFFSIKIS